MRIRRYGGGRHRGLDREQRRSVGFRMIRRVVIFWAIFDRMSAELIARFDSREAARSALRASGLSSIEAGICKVVSCR